MALQHRPPRDQTEFAGRLDDCEPPAGKIDGVTISAFDPLAVAGGSVGKVHIPGELVAHTGQFTPPQRGQHIWPVSDLAGGVLRQAFGDQPLPAASLRLAHRAAKAAVAWRVCVGCQATVQPGCPVRAGLLFQ